LTDDTNHAIFPNDRGEFSSLQLKFGGHYEIHGDGTMDEMIQSGRSHPLPAATPSFSFAQRSTTLSAASTSVRKAPPVKTFQRYA